MIQVFEKDGHINFVDDKNRFVGFDLRADCCEDFGWCVSPVLDCPEKPKSESVPEGWDWSKWVLSPNSAPRVSTDGWLEEGQRVSFELRDARHEWSLPAAWLHIWNSHNGYYAHGYEVKLDPPCHWQGSI